MRKEQIVVFTGPTGVKKKTCLAAVVAKFLEKKGLSVPSGRSAEEILTDPETERYIRYFSLEDEVESILPRRYSSLLLLLGEDDPDTQRDYWALGFKSLHKKLAAVPSNVTVFVELHSCCFRGHSRIHSINPQDVLQLNPSCFITLVDDVYSIYFRVNEREKENPEGSYLRLQDILEWRHSEMIISDQFAASLGVKNYVVAVKHPVSTLCRLIFERKNKDMLPLYVAYPISAPRKKSHNDENLPDENDFRTTGQKEMDQNRLQIHNMKNCIVFDPITVDERALQVAFQEQFGEDSINRVPELTGEWVKLQRRHRWPLLSEEFPPVVPDPPSIFPLELPAQEVHAIIHRPLLRPHHSKRGRWKSLVDSQIQFRDFHYVRNAERIAAYRPSWNGEIHDGMRAELNYAHPRIYRSIYHKVPEDGPEDSSPFVKDNDMPMYYDLESFYGSLKQIKKK